MCIKKQQKVILWHGEGYYKQGRAECGECGGEVVPVAASSARALGACLVLTQV